MDENSKYRFFRKLTKKYRLLILNNGTFEERIMIKITPLMVLLVILVVGFLIVISSFAIINSFKKSSLDKSPQENKDLINRSSQLDSLIRVSEKSVMYLENVKSILRGGDVKDSSLDVKNKNDIEGNIDLEKNSGDYILVSSNTTTHFFPPLVGNFTEKYNWTENHFGVDLVSTEGSFIHSIDDGIVVINNWTVETGFVIGVQHSDGFLSFYKHNSENLKDVGDFVKRGEGIAIIGNSGELSSGPHLHFELWKNGESINPENHILF